MIKLKHSKSIPNVRNVRGACIQLEILLDLAEFVSKRQNSEANTRIAFQFLIQILEKFFPNFSYFVLTNSSFTSMAFAGLSKFKPSAVKLFLLSINPVRVLHIPALLIFI